MCCGSVFFTKVDNKSLQVVAEPPDGPAGHRLEKPLTGPGPDPGLL